MYPNARLAANATKIGLGIAAIIVLLLLTVRVVGVGQVGVKTRLGKVVGQYDSGVVIKAPWPIERLYKFDVKTQKDQAEVAAASNDLQDVNATIVTNYHIDNTKVGNLFTTVG